MKPKKIRNFQVFHQNGRRRPGRLANAHYRWHLDVPPESRTAENLALAVVASKKGVDKRAVRRNRAKRRLRAAMAVLWETRGFRGRMAPDEQLELSFLAQRRLLECSWQELLAELEQHLNAVFAARGARP